MVGREVFLMEPKHQYHLSWRGEFVLWCAIIKSKEIIARIYVYPNWLMKFGFESWWDMNFFLWNRSINSFIWMRRLLCLIRKRNEIIVWIRVYPNWQTNFDSKKWWEKKFFLWNQTINIIYTNKENVLVLSNH